MSVDDMLEMCRNSTAIKIAIGSAVMSLIIYLWNSFRNFCHRMDASDLKAEKRKLVDTLVDTNKTNTEEKVIAKLREALHQPHDKWTMTEDPTTGSVLTCDGLMVVVPVFGAMRLFVGNNVPIKVDVNRLSLAVNDLLDKKMRQKREEDVQKALTML